ncbi:cdc42 effector protein 4 [Pygocentrus nattereri]|uniref:cdc42 effector protein 4 n=1 Tax=Pygocentrus nattereri TaxID=42514 RepID=UPI00081486CD|nr:cdc42 effector protein 4 [Pygocentrus nattereri]
MPILKQLVSGSSQSKRRSRADLTAEMISAPLGDFRHTMHVGRGGDAFGDTSFLSSRSGEPPRDSQPQQISPKQGLLSRTFRSSKRSQSVNRPDKNENTKTPPSSGSPGYVKTAISLPYLNNEDTNQASRGEGPNLPKSVSSSPVKILSEVDQKLASFADRSDPELDEHNFGVLTDLPVSLSPPCGGGMKHAESILSFHVDLGPSMLGDILGVMDKKVWDEADFGYEDDHGSPASRPVREPKEVKEAESPVHLPNLQSRNEQQHLDSCSMSSSESVDEKPNSHNTDIKNRATDDRDFTYMDEDDDDEIRV